MKKLTLKKRRKKRQEAQTKKGGNSKNRKYCAKVDFPQRKKVENQHNRQTSGARKKLGDNREKVGLDFCIAQTDLVESKP